MREIVRLSTTCCLFCLQSLPSLSRFTAYIHFLLRSHTHITNILLEWDLEILCMCCCCCSWLSFCFIVSLMRSLCIYVMYCTSIDFGKIQFKKVFWSTGTDFTILLTLSLEHFFYFVILTFFESIHTNQL